MDRINIIKMILNINDNIKPKDISKKEIDILLKKK